MENQATTYSKIWFWSAMGLAQVGAFIIFKDLADISQWVVQSSREFTMFVWFNRWPIAITTLFSLFISLVIWARNTGILHKAVLIPLVILCLVNWYSGMFNTLLMFRPQQMQGQAKFVSIAEAPAYLERMKHAAYEKDAYSSIDEIEMLVLETDDGARAYADYYLLQPHIVDGGFIGGERVVMTYCGLTNMGIAYTPKLNGQPLNLRVMTQLRNNLVMWDTNSGEPIQQFWGTAESYGQQSERMKEWPTYRMPFDSFRALYPHGKVYINNIEQQSENAMTRAWDRLVRDGMMLLAVKTLQWQSERPAFPTIKEFDARLPIKQLIYGINVGKDYVAYTKDFIKAEGGLINVVIGGKSVALVYDGQYDSLAAFYNDSGNFIESVDLFGLSNQGPLKRVNTLKSKIFWFIWRDFYKSTDVNRV